MRFSCVWLTVSLFLACSAPVAAQTTAPSFPSTLFRKPVRVYGDPQYTGTASNPTAVVSTGPNLIEGREFNAPQGVALDTTVTPPILYVADTANHRIMAFRFESQVRPGTPADLILGQPDRFQNLSSSQAGRTIQLSSPTGMAVDRSGNLYVADTGNNRILRYARPFAQPAGYQIPDLILGQKSFATVSANQGRATPGADTLSLAVSRAGLTFDAQGNLWVTDTGNNRVLRYGVGTLNSNPGNGPNADTVLGQIDMVGVVAATAFDSKVNLNRPTGLAFDTNGRLFVVDGSARVVVYPAGAGTNTNAIRIMGFDRTPGAVLPTAVSLSNPVAVAASGAGVVVADSGNHRLMVYPPVENWAPETTQFSPTAISVIGQASFRDNKANQGAGDASASSFSFPRDLVASGNELFVADSGNHRVLAFTASPAGVSSSANRVIGQLDYAYFGPNLVEGREFSLSNSAVGTTGSVILDYSASPPYLYVSDTGNNRILGFRDFAAYRHGQKADLVIGQPDLFRTMINYPSNLATQPTAQNLNGPTGLAVDSAGNLYVADTGNSRVLRFPAPFKSGQTSLQSADLVIGQSSFTSSVTDATERTINAPTGLAFTADGFKDSVKDAGWLLVSDANHHRVLFFQKPFSSGMSANKVLGQLNFSSTSTSRDAQRFSSPRAVAVDPQDRVLVLDTGNDRLQIFTRASALANFATPAQTITGFSTALSITMSSQGSFWVVDSGLNRVLHYPPVDQIPLRATPSDGFIPAQSPRSAFVDAAGNLLVGDGVNRLLYFVPQVDIVNGANYSTRPLSPGTIASLFPTQIANVATNGTVTLTPSSTLLSDGTEAVGAGQFPLPFTLADTQVVVNGSPSPLLFVSPGQINLALSNSLPAGGSVDLQVVKASTGQIYAAAELGMATASPAFYTLTTTGSGQIIAQNFPENVLNSPQNPVQKGEVLVMYGTGAGFIPNAPPDGFSASGQRTTELPQVLIGSVSNGTAAFVPADNILFSGLTPTLVGLWQINVRIPTTAPSGSAVPIVVLLASVPSTDPTAPVTAATTIAIK